MEARSLNNGSCGSTSGKRTHEYGDWGADGGDKKKI
jgi:hypothetical protein